MSIDVKNIRKMKHMWVMANNTHSGTLSVHYFLSYSAISDHKREHFSLLSYQLSTTTIFRNYFFSRSHTELSGTCWARWKYHKVRITVHLGLIRIINSTWSHSLEEKNIFFSRVSPLQKKEIFKKKFFWDSQSPLCLFVNIERI